MVLARLHRFVQAKTKYHCSFGTCIIKPRRKPTTRGGKSEYLPKSNQEISPDVIYPPYIFSYRSSPCHLITIRLPPQPASEGPLVRICPENGDQTSASTMPFATWCCFSNSQPYNAKSPYNAETPIPYLKSPCFPSVSSAEAASEIEVGSTR